MALGCEQTNRVTSISMDELEIAAKPLLDLLNKKADPYVFVTVQQGQINMSRHEIVIPTDVPD